MIELTRNATNRKLWLRLDYIESVVDQDNGSLIWTITGHSYNVTETALDVTVKMTDVMHQLTERGLLK
jgi:hypothetical protein